jgi:hypothetical protein
MAKRRKSADDGGLDSDREGDITSKIERLELFEERLGVRLESLSAFLDPGDPPFALNVYGELHPRDGTELRDNVELVVAVYDRGGRIVGTSSASFDAENFFGLETFQVFFYVPVKDIVRVRVYPKKG